MPPPAVEVEAPSSATAAAGAEAPGHREREYPASCCCRAAGGADAPRLAATTVASYQRTSWVDGSYRRCSGGGVGRRSPELRRWTSAGEVVGSAGEVMGTA